MPHVPSVSIVIPLYNKEPYIARAINSVLNQTIQDFEVIVVDDGSTDEGNIVVKMFEDPRIILIKQENQGVSAARNRGIEEANAELIAFLDADDEWLPRFLETILRLRRLYPEAGAYATAFMKEFHNGISQKQPFSGIPPGDWEGIIPSYFKSCAYGRLPVRSSNVAIPKDVFSDIGMFPVGVWWGEDADMWGRIAMKYPIAFSSNCCAIYQVGAVNRTCKTLNVTEIHPFVRTASKAIERGDVQASVLPDLERYITKEIIQTAYVNLGAGRRDIARQNLSLCPPDILYCKQIITIIWTYLPTSLFHLRAQALERVLYGILKVMRYLGR
jgi:glycosyltransferase involved in cell wall biosynthesis